MKIDCFSGSIVFPEGTVAPQLERSTFLNASIGAKAKKVLENAGFVHLSFNPEVAIHATALFKDDRIHQLFVLMAIPSDETSEWTEHHELERKAVHDTWLQNELGEPPYEYAWGSVNSEYDPRGCVSDIIITYAS